VKIRLPRMMRELILILIVSIKHSFQYAILIQAKDGIVKEEAPGM
jgi:hypothetical protein